MRARPAGEALARVRAAYGVVLIVAPRALLSELAGGRADAPAVACARVLGVRQLVEAAILVRHGRRRRWLVAGAAVDALHALTVAGLAAARPEHRRLALLNLAVASALIAADLHAATAG